MAANFPCVCDICNCGRHRCPHKLRTTAPWDKCNLSEYNRSYVPHEVCPVASLKPPFKPILGEGPLSKETTQRTDYIPHCIDPPKPFGKTTYLKPEGDMDTTTMYRKEYGPKEACPRPLARPPPRRSVPAKFQSDTTQRDDYKAWDIPPRQSFRPKDYVASEDKLDDMTSYKTNYVPHCIDPPKSYKPGAHFINSEVPMAKDTDYRDSYVAHPLEPRKQKPEVCIPTKRAPLDSLTIHRKEFTPKEICPQKSFKPPPHLIDKNTPMSDQTTHRTDYILHDMDKPFKYEPNKYLKPDGDIDLQTTYNKEYTTHQACLPKSVKPPERPKVHAPFSDATNYRDNYQKWDVPPVRSAKRDDYEPPTDKFDDCTTTKSAYVPHEICPPQSFKPPPHLMSKEPFDDSTLYRTEYTKKNFDYCPAAYLSTDERAVSPDGYIYHNEDDRGHLHYRRGRIPLDSSRHPAFNNANNSTLQNTDFQKPFVSVTPLSINSVPTTPESTSPANSTTNKVTLPPIAA